MHVFRENREVTKQDHLFPSPLGFVQVFFQPIELRLAKRSVPGGRALGQLGVVGLRLANPGIPGRIRVQADIVAVQRNEPIAAPPELIITFLQSKHSRHLGFLIIGHVKIVIAKDVVVIRLEPLVDWHHIGEARKIPVDKVAEMHHKLKVEPIQVIDTGRQLFCRHRVLARSRLCHLDVAILAVGDNTKREQRLADRLVSRQSGRTQPNSNAQKNSFHCLTRSLLCSCIHNISGFSGVETLSFNSRPLVSGGTVRGSSHL